MAAGPDISEREDLTGSLTEQRGRVSRLREAGAADYEIRPAVKALESLLRSVILEQGARLRRLRSDTAGQAQCEEAVARLQALKAEFQEVSGKVWRDVREEGPSYAEIRDQRAQGWQRDDATSTPLNKTALRTRLEPRRRRSWSLRNQSYVPSWPLPPTPRFSTGWSRRCWLRGRRRKLPLSLILLEII